MTQPFLGQIQPFGFGFAPRNWALCNGQILSIAQNTALFALLGTMYGGNGQTTFALPNLQSRVPMHKGTFVGNSYVQGEEAGTETITLNLNELPAHNHTLFGNNAGAFSKVPATGNAYAQTTKVPPPVTPGDPYYASDATTQPINPNTIKPYGQNGSHTNIQPYLTINWCIAMAGVFPARN
jgi:microcystin-dependent protein